MVKDETGFEVVERILRKRDRLPVEILHLCRVGDLPGKVTLCGRSFDNRTMIPLESWGNPDRVWCAQCFRAMTTENKSVLSRRKRRLIDFRGRSAVATDSGTPEE